MTIWSKLAKARTAAQLADERTAQQRRLEEKVAALAGLRAGAGRGPFDNPNFDPRAAGAAIRDLEAEIEADRAVLVEIGCRHAAAIQAEEEKVLDATLAERERIVVRMRKGYASFHQHAAAATAEREMLLADRGRLNELNAIARQGGRQLIDDPIHAHRQALGDRQFLDPLEGFRAMDYAPAHPDGPPLATFRE